MRRFLALVVALEVAALQRLVEVLRGQHAEHDRHAGRERRRLEAPRRLPGHIFEVRGVAPDHRAEAHDAVDGTAPGQVLRDERRAQSRLDDIIDGETRNVIAGHNLIEVVRTTNRAFEKAEEAEDIMEAESMRQIELGRDKITRLILERVSNVVPDYGIELVDVQIQRINYIESVQAKVFDRMISERKRIADRHRSEGQGKSAEVRGKKERELKVIESEAYRKTQEIMGRGDAEATSIYAEAYNHNRELYRFLKTMETYRSTIDKESWLVLSTSTDVFRYLQSQNAVGNTGKSAVPNR